jgi:holo-[acyl-carrier protein] synthase
MICGIGTDIVEVNRIREAVRKWRDHFLKRVFSEAEITYCFSRSDPALHLAARFAAKEAAIKAVSFAGPGHLSLSDIEVINEPSGKPALKIRSADFDSSGIRFHLSISHERSYAIASIVAEKG